MTDIAKLVADLTLDEKAALTAGTDLWSTAAVPRLGIPAVRLTDGPNGARGGHLGPSGPTSACVPCGSALGATWNPRLVEEVGALVGQQARTKSARVLLAPTVNMHRSPLAGRNFECYSEDPLLSGLLAAAFVRGAQSQGVATTVKHLVGNDAEHERMTISSEIDERALREIYLRPFELAVREGGALGVMTSYNRVNGRWCTERPELLRHILRDEWGFAGFVLTDWFAVAGTVASAEAGVDLEMPGPARAFGPALAAAVRAGELDERAVDHQVTRLLTVFDRIGALEDDGAGPDLDGEQSIDRTEDRTVARRAATEAMVLLANDGLLPLDRTALSTVAVIGPNADRAQIMGGGSAAVRAHYLVTPLEALRTALGDGVRVVHERGCDNRRSTPPLGGSATEAPGGAAGFDIDYFANPDLGGEVAHHAHAPILELFALEPPAPVLPRSGWSLRATTRFTPAESGTHTFTLIQAGRARVIVDGDVVIDGFTDPPPPGEAFYGLGSAAAEAPVELTAGRPVEVVVELSTGSGRAHGAIRVGCRVPEPGDLLDRAAAAAAEADLAVLVVGTTAEWESEGRDRPSMDLPGDQDELVRRVLDANPATVVVVNAGSPVTMDWAGHARALLQVWFGGQEMAGGLADVLLGDAEPAGRLPMTLPVRLEHNPSFGNFPGENGAVRYGEGVLVGYRWYEARRLPTRFPFGHGGSYTTFALGPPELSSTTYSPGAGGGLTVSVPVTNAGRRRGAEVVQCYVAPTESRLVRPPQELRAFAKVWLDPGETATARFELDDRAFAYWDPGQPDREAVAARATALGGRRRQDAAPEPGWRVDPGRYELHIGRSSAAIDHVVEVEVESPRQ
ncbi:MAG TPA: glycoside hydrolase family 3 C-terminal domain-containing protein [Acidimicrobiales bacterium]|nr:glycoside hydrolase family 3 C-terminal domain-containing protein [Acidimicrobiales bacterium]